MTKLILVRHGETEWNRTGRYQGQSDIELNTTGLWQAERLRDRLVRQRIDAAYSSDLKRALHTAQIIISKHNLVMIPCKELREIDFGELEGMTSDEIQRHYPNWHGMSSDVSIPGGESISQLASRIELFVPRLVEYSGDKTVLIVAHGGTLQMLVCILLGIGTKYWRQIRLDSASLTIVESRSGRMVLSLLNDTCHLEDYRLE
jgi:Fructose-2,6-bisphosphatase